MAVPGRDDCIARLRGGVHGVGGSVSDLSSGFDRAAILDIRLQRFYVAGLARSSDYETALLGTSMLENIPNSAVKRLCGGPAVNLCVSAASIHEEAEVLKLALKHPEQDVVATLDFNSLSGGVTGQVVGVHRSISRSIYTATTCSKSFLTCFHGTPYRPRFMCCAAFRMKARR